MKSALQIKCIIYYDYYHHYSSETHQSNSLAWQHSERDVLQDLLSVEVKMLSRIQ